MDLDSAVNIFFDALHQFVFDCVPEYFFRVSIFQPWFSKELKQLLLLKKKAHVKFKALFNYDYREFSFLRARFKYESRKFLRIYALCAEMSLKIFFFQFVGYLLAINYSPYDYSLVAAQLVRHSLVDRRCMLCIKFLKGLFGEVNSSDLLTLLNFKVSYYLTHSFVSFFTSTNYIKNTIKS